MLTTQQKQTIKADILANPTLSAYWTQGQKSAIAAYYNETASPDFYVWRTSIPFSEIMDNLVAADWTAMDNLTVGQDRIWENLKGTGSFKAASAAHRAALAECWKGTQAKLDVGTRILGLGKRVANNIEKLLATGTGSEGTPATMSYEGTIDWSTIDLVMTS